MMIFALLLSLVVGWILRGSIRNLASLELRRFELMLAGFAIQMLLSRAPALGWEFLIYWGFPLLVASYVILLFVLWENRHLPGMSLISAGAACNLAVIACNGGMPVSRAALAVTGQEGLVPVLESGTSVIHVLMSQDTVLAFLGDNIPTPGWFPLRTVVSPGDLIMMLGILWLVPRAMLGPAVKKELSHGGQETETDQVEDPGA
ncbi:MAG: DUF5317 domain-containing protein [Bacillota bacterium]